MSLPEIQAVLFDLGNTLVSYYQRHEFTDVLRKCIRSSLCLCSLESAPEDQLLARALDLDRESSDHKVRPLAERLGALFPEFTHAPEDRVEILSRAFLQPIFDCARLHNDSIATLQALRSAGIRTAIVSNTPWGSPAHLWRDELRRHGLLELVDGAVFCVDVGYRKPHSAPFEHALARLEVAPTAAVFVGDDPVWDVDGARRAGLRAVLLSGPTTATAPNCDVIEHLESLIELVGKTNNRSRSAV